jgi:MFS family permease
VTAAGPSSRWAPIAALAGVLALRMLGLFLLLPVLALHARAFPDATPLLAGLAVGVYGLTQALLQVPFGAWSDRVGRRRVIVAGLLVFAFGSAVAALADSIWVVILGRALQGAGAISSAATAFAADLTPPGLRTRAMATLGIAVGASFTVAIVVGPPLAGALGVAGVFWSTGALALLAIGLVLATLPDRPAPAVAAAGPEVLRGFYRTKWPTLAGVLTIHALITTVFVAVPGLLVDAARLPLAAHWRVYLPAFAAGLVVLTAPLVLWSERGGAPAWPQRAAFGAAAAGLASAALGAADAAGLALALALFFGGFNFLEASYPAAIAEAVAPEHRGRAMGVYATLQFVGAFVGGALGGALLGAVGARGALLAAAALALAAIATVVGRDAARP